MADDLKHARPAIRKLVGLLQSRAAFSRPCYIKRSATHAALIAPHLMNGEVGPYSWLRTFRRDTVHEAIVLGYVVLGGDLVEVPPHEGPSDAWYRSADHQGRTIRKAGDPR